MTALDHGPNRHSIRLRGYDYTRAGAYFVTICTAGRDCLFGDIQHDQTLPTDLGQIVLACWDDIPLHFATVDIDAFVLMPNHLHGIILINAPDPAHQAMHASLLPPDADTYDMPRSVRPHPVGAMHASPNPECTPSQFGNVAPIPERSGNRPRAMHASPLPDGRAPTETPRGSAPGSLGAIIGAFKAATTRRINAQRDTPGVTLWQRGYYDHIIRNDQSLERIRSYIAANPSRWPQDDDNPANAHHR